MEDEEPPDRSGYAPRGSVTIKSPPVSDRKDDFSRHVFDEGYHSLSGSSISSQRSVAFACWAFPVVLPFIFILEMRG